MGIAANPYRTGAIHWIPLWRPLRNFGRMRQNYSLSLGGCLISRLDKQNRASTRASRSTQHERDLPFPFALSLSKGKSTLSNALLRQAPGERVGVRGNLHRFSPVPRVRQSYEKVSLRKPVCRMPTHVMHEYNCTSGFHRHRRHANTRELEQSHARCAASDFLAMTLI